MLLCIIAVISFIANPAVKEYEESKGLPWESYEPSYFLKFQSIGDIIQDADHHFKASQRTTLPYYNHVASIVRKRFYHGYSHYTLADNPIAFLSGKFFWDHLSAIVIPEDIMKYPMAACSQQALVLMEVFKRNGIDYRKVGFDHHYTVEGFIEGQWRYFDTDMEPDLANERSSIKTLLQTGRIKEVYKNVGWTDQELFANVGHPVYDLPNKAPAPNAQIFHSVCAFLVSWYFLLGYLVLLVVFSLKKSAKKEQPFLAPIFGYSRRKRA